MILVNTNDIPGKEISEVVGLVRGSTIQSKHIGKDFLAGLKTIVCYIKLYLYTHRLISICITIRQPSKDQQLCSKYS